MSMKSMFSRILVGGKYTKEYLLDKAQVLRGYGDAVLSEAEYLEIVTMINEYTPA